MVQGRSDRAARPTERRAVPSAPARRRHRHSREALDAPAGDRLRHRSERGRALRRQPGAGVLVHDRRAEAARAARQGEEGARRQVQHPRVPQRGARRRHACRSSCSRSRSTPICKTATVVASLPKGEQVVPVYHEPHHRMLFAYGTTRILEGQVPPGDTSWYHTHAEPILYITLSASAQRTQVLGEDWGRGRGEGGAPAAAPGRGGARRGAAAVRRTPAVDRCCGPRARRAITIRPSRIASQTPATGCFASWSSPTRRPATRALRRQWRRIHGDARAHQSLVPRLSHQTCPRAGDRNASPHDGIRHRASLGRTGAWRPDPMPWELSEAGRWAWFDGGKAPSDQATSAPCRSKPSRSKCGVPRRTDMTIRLVGRRQSRTCRSS